MKIQNRRITVAALALAVALAAAPIFAADAPSGVVNLNSASSEQLQLLPGIGPALAARILEHREQNGAFKSATDLMLVKGIGEKSFEKLKPFVAVSGTTTLAEEVRLPRAEKPTATTES